MRPALPACAVPPGAAMADLIFWSDDQRFGLFLPAGLFAELCALCQAAGEAETGGVLVGWYTEARDCAVVTQIGQPPSDSRRGRATFVRGTRGLKKMLEEAGERDGSRYLGEWHFHPGASPVFSHVDAEQMTRIANSRSANCPEPILLILGGGAPNGWEPSVHVFPRGQPPVGLPLQTRELTA